MPRKQDAFNIDSLMASERQNLTPMAVPVVSEDKPLGRPKSKRTCSKASGVAQTIFFTQEDKKLLNTCAFLAEIDQQDIVRCALRKFFEEYVSDKELTEEGRALVQQYIDATTIA